MKMTPRDNELEADECFCQAFAIAKQQKAKPFELRAATSLARLWRVQGRAREAYKLICDTYYWFTEGFEMADQREAKELINSLNQELSISKAF